jgi:hypothetical protein
MNHFNQLSLVGDTSSSNQSHRMNISQNIAIHDAFILVFNQHYGFLISTKALTNIATHYTDQMSVGTTHEKINPIFN